MNNLRNKVQLIGNVGQLPEVKTLDNGRKVANITLATNETYINAKGEKITNTQWHTLVAWGKSAEIVENYVKKGDEIAVEGKIQYETYDDKEGNKRYSTKININDILMLGSKS
jgi:single-strand DNA-binding protein